MEEKDKKLDRMTVVIAGRSYPVKVTEAEARILPNIEKDINDQLRKMQLSFKELDMQDCLSMVLLTKSLASKNNAGPSANEAEQKVDDINALIQEVL